jgi:hypothetical protein
MRSTPEIVAATVNGCLVLCFPVLLVALPAIFSSGSAVRPVDTSLASDMIRVVALFASVTLPLGLIAAWRTWFYARRWRIDREKGLRGVLEAGALGFSAILVLRILGLRSTSSNVSGVFSPPFVIVYGGLAFVLGLLVGLVLWGVALIILRSTQPQ